MTVDLFRKNRLIGSHLHDSQKRIIKTVTLFIQDREKTNHYDLQRISIVQLNFDRRAALTLISNSKLPIFAIHQWRIFRYKVPPPSRKTFLRPKKRQYSPYVSESESTKHDVKVLPMFGDFQSWK